MRTSARYKNLSARGRLGKSGAFCYSFSVDTSFNVRCILYVVTSVLQDQQYMFGVKSLLMVEKVLVMRNIQVAVLFFVQKNEKLS